MIMMPAATINTPGCRPPLFPVCFPRHNPCFLANSALLSGLSLVSTLNVRTTFSLPIRIRIRAIANSKQGNSDGSNHKKVLKSANVSTFAKALVNFTMTNFLPIALISGVVLGFSNPTLGCLAHKYSLSKFSTCGIFFISGLKLRGGEIQAVAEAWPAGILGLIFECSLGLARDLLDRHYQIEPFDERYEEASRKLVFSELYEAKKQTVNSWVFELEYSEKNRIFDGRTGDPFDQPVIIGKSYILKLIHQVDDKIRGHSSGGYALVTQQPLRGRAKQGGQQVSILLVSPLFSRLILQVQLAPQEFVTGLAIFSCMPTTLSSGVALTQLVGGNSALALAMTVISNLLAILTVPFWISNVFADGFGASIPTGELFWSLIFTLLVPLVLGKVVRNMLKGLATYIDQNQRIFSMMSTVLLSLTPWMQVSKSRPLILMLKPKGFIDAMGMGILVHLTLLGFNAIAVKCMSAGFGGGDSIFSKKENFRALLLVCSQKALLIVVAVVDQLSGVVGESGLLVLPCVVAHINQVIIDSVLVNFWLWKDLSYNKDFEA